MKFFKNSKIQVFGLSFAILLAKLFSPSSVYANGACGILPCGIAQPCFGLDCGNGDALSLAMKAVVIGLGLVFILIFIYGIYLIIQAAVKITRSEGNEEQIQSGYKMVKGVYIGIAMIIVGIIGLVVLFALLNATSIFGVTPQLPEGVNFE